MPSTVATISRTLVALNLATTLKDAGVDVLRADIGKLGLRVDVRGKASAVLAQEMLVQAGLREARALREGRGVWLVVGLLPVPGVQGESLQLKQ